MSSPFTHKELCIIAAKWLKNTLKCTISINEPKGIRENPDAIGWKFTYGTTAKEGSILVECKTSRADFKADFKKPFRQDPSKGIGNWRYYMCPEGIIYESELPDKWGLAYVTDKGKVKVIKHPYIKDTRKSKFKDINTENERYLLTRWLSKTEDPEKVAYNIRETNNKFNRLCTQYDKLKVDNKRLYKYKGLFENYTALSGTDISIEELHDEISRLRNIEYLLSIYKDKKDDKILEQLLTKIGGQDII